MTSYNKNDLAIIADQTGFLRDQLEKVIRLTDILRFFHEDSFLRQTLALKGGTAINMICFSMPRLSVDIDLDYCRDVDRETMLNEREQITTTIHNYMQSNGYSLSPHTKHPHSLDSWVFSYINAAGNHDVIKVEMNYSMRCHVLPIVEKEVRLAFTDPFFVMSLAPLELFGSKIKALIERCACRDLYDVHNMLETKLFTNEEEKKLLRQIVTFYRCVGGNSIPIKPIDLTKIESIRFPQIRAQLIPVIKKTERFDFERAKQQVMHYLAETLCPSKDETLFIEAFNQGVFKPELLFSDDAILQRISQHPMALWKIQQLSHQWLTPER